MQTASAVLSVSKPRNPMLMLAVPGLCMSRGGVEQRYRLLAGTAGPCWNGRRGTRSCAEALKQSPGV